MHKKIKNIIFPHFQLGWALELQMPCSPIPLPSTFPLALPQHPSTLWFATWDVGLVAAWVLHWCGMREALCPHRSAFVHNSILPGSELFLLLSSE